MLVLIGREVKGEEDDPLPGKNMILVDIPSDDGFRCSDLVCKATEPAELSEIYDSHDSLSSFYKPSAKESDFVKSCLRSKAKATTQEYLKDLWEDAIAIKQEGQAEVETDD
jgi:hypothetical protein